MAKQNCEILQYGEIDQSEDVRLLNPTTNDHTWYLTRGDDEALVESLRLINEEERDEDDGEYYWKLQGVSHTPRTTTVEFRSGRGHIAVAVILWEIPNLDFQR
jgi:hypothetical protein